MSGFDAASVFKYRADFKTTHISQGDVIRDVELTLGLSGGESPFDEVTLPYAIVMSQECDLEQDFENAKMSSDEIRDKCLPTILLCPAYNKEQFKTGEHLISSAQKMRPMKAKEVEKLYRNSEYERYHFLRGDGTVTLPDLVIDFKHFYTCPRGALYELYAKGYAATVETLFRERLSQRFASYLSRIGLPNLPDEVMVIE